MDSDRVDHTLALIDGAIEDWSTSVDGMRWTPPVEAWDERAEPIVAPPRTRFERYVVIFDEDRRLGADIGKGEQSVWQVAIERRKHRNTGPVVGRYRLDGSRR